MLNFRKICRVDPEKTALEALWAHFGVFWTHLGGPRVTQKCRNLIKQLQVEKKKITCKMEPIWSSSLLLIEFGPNIRPKVAPLWPILVKQEFSQITHLLQFL